MISWQQDIPIYLYREVVDFRKSINGLSVIVDEAMGLSPFDVGIFVFCNRRRDKIKVLYSATAPALLYLLYPYSRGIARGLLCGINA